MTSMPKHYKYFKEMVHILNRTNLIKNLELMHKSHLDEKACMNNGEQTPFWNNLYTAQAIEIFRELLINSSTSIDIGLDIKTLSNVIWNYTKVKDDLNRRKIRKSEKTGRQKGDILYPLSHKQFWYQRIENELLNHLNYIYNYYKSIWFDKYIQQAVWISLERLLIVWFLISHVAEKNVYIDLEREWQLFGKERDIIIREYSIDLDELVAELTNDYKTTSIFKDITEFEYYGLWIIFDKPLIKVDWKYMCVFPILLLNRVTNAIYHLFDRKFRDKEYWDINEWFIVSLFKKLSSANVIHTKDFEEDYSQHDKPSNPDVIIEQWVHVLFIECKSNSITYNSIKNGLSEGDKEKIKGNIKQIYKAISFYTELDEGAKYFWLNKKWSDLIIPVISYVNNPYLGFWDYLEEIVDEVIIENEEITTEIVKKFPLMIIWNKDIVYLLNILNSIWLADFYSLVYSDEYKWWELEAIISDIYKKRDIGDEIFYDFSFDDLLKEEWEKYV